MSVFSGLTDTQSILNLFCRLISLEFRSNQRSVCSGFQVRSCERFASQHARRKSHLMPNVNAESAATSPRLRHARHSRQGNAAARRSAAHKPSPCALCRARFLGSDLLVQAQAAVWAPAELLEFDYSGGMSPTSLTWPAQRVDPGQLPETRRTARAANETTEVKTRDGQQHRATKPERLGERMRLEQVRRGAHADDTANHQHETEVPITISVEVLPQRHGAGFYDQRPLLASAWLTEIGAPGRYARALRCAS
jgi:hypothetical protein